MAGIESERPESYIDPSNSPMSPTGEDSSSSKSKSPMSATDEDSSSSKSKSPISATDEDSSSSKSKSPMSATEEDSSSSKSKSPMSPTEEDKSMSSSKAVSADVGVEEGGDYDYDEYDFFDFGNDPYHALSDSEDDLYYDPGRRKLTPEESSFYAKQVRDSDGFDIDPPPDGARAYGTIFPGIPMDDNCRKFTELAIQRYNSEENNSRKVKLKRLIKWNQQTGSPINYYITFEAEELDTGEVETYQTLVLLRIPEEETEVDIFRVKPRPEPAPPTPTQDQDSR